MNYAPPCIKLSAYTCGRPAPDSPPISTSLPPTFARRVAHAASTLCTCGEGNSAGMDPSAHSAMTFPTVRLRRRSPAKVGTPPDGVDGILWLVSLSSPNLSRRHGEIPSDVIARTFRGDSVVCQPVTPREQRWICRPARPPPRFVAIAGGRPPAGGTRQVAGWVSPASAGGALSADSFTRGSAGTPGMLSQQLGAPPRTFTRNSALQRTARSCASN